MNRQALIFGAIVSILLLLILGLSQHAQARFLDLPPQWMGIAVFPIILALFIGGYISRFKGFGVELEATLKQPITTMSFTASDAIADIPGDEKRSMGYLENLSGEKARSIQWLLFVAGRTGYYYALTIDSYLRRLPNIDFLEVRTERGDIVGFLPVSAVRGPDGQPDEAALHRFVSAVESGDLASQFPSAAITLRVQGEQSLVDVLQKLRSERADFAAVISSDGRYLGVVQARDVERRIADSVLSTARR